MAPTGMLMSDLCHSTYLLVNFALEKVSMISALISFLGRPRS